MTDLNDLLQAVLDAPGDDAPRLVYADWLEEHGQTERAQLIRLQVEKARAGIAAGSPRYREFLHREYELWSAYRRRAPWPPSPLDAPMPGVELGFPVRGFAESVTFLAPAAFSKFARVIFDRLPVRELVLKTPDILGALRVARRGEWTPAAAGRVFGS